MKKLYFLFFGIVLVFISACCSKEACTPIKMEKNAILIDVRTPDEFKTAHIQGAINIPYDKIHTAITRSVPEKSTPVYLYCRSGRRSSIALKTVKGMGYRNVYDLGGFQDARKKLNVPEK